MSNCNQTHNQTILEHGIAVHEEWLNLKPYGFLIPYWDALQEDIAKWDPNDIRTYHIFHDCGKPFCHSQDEQGSHFLNHAEISYQTWLDYYGEGQIATWIRHDMDIHILRADEIDGFL